MKKIVYVNKNGKWLAPIKGTINNINQKIINLMSEENTRIYFDIITCNNFSRRFI